MKALSAIGNSENKRNIALYLIFEAERLINFQPHKAFLAGSLPALLLCISLFNAISVSGQASTLDHYLEQGVLHSPLLKDYNLQLQIANVDSQIIRASLRPFISANSAVIYAPNGKGYGYDQAITNGGTYAALVGINQPLLINKARQAQFNTIGLQKQSIVNTTKISEHELRKSIADQYIIAYENGQLVKFSQQVNDLLHKEMELLKAQADAGIYKLADLLAFSIEMRSNEIELEQFRQQYRDGLFVLNYLCGITDTGFVQLEAPSIQYHVSSSAFVSPAFLKFTFDSALIQNGKKLIDLNYRPKMNAFADAGVNAVALKDVPNRFGFSAGLSFSVPIYDGHLRNLEYSKLNIAEQSRKNYRDFLSSQVIVKMQQLEAEKKANDALLQKINDELHDMESLLEMKRRQLGAGNISVTDYIFNLHSFIGIKGKIAEMEIKSYSLINEYNYLVW